MKTDGRYYIYTVKTPEGTYKVHGNQLMSKHTRELQALAELKERNKVVAFAKGAGDAVVTPIKSVYSTVTSPVKAANNAYDNAKDTYKSAKKGLSKAKTFVTNKGKLPKETAKREKDGMIAGIVGRPDALREAAFKLKVDPYTHYKPLRSELKSYASARAAGSFGVDTGLGMIPGVGGYVVLSVTTVDSITRRTLNKSPKEMAEVNRERLLGNGTSRKAVDKFLLNSQYTPSEKTIYTGYVKALERIPGAKTALVEFGGTPRNRSTAFSNVVAIKMLNTLHGKQKITKIENVNGQLIAYHHGNATSVILPYDRFSWTHKNEANLQKLRASLKHTAGGNTKLVVLGDVTGKSRSAIRQLSWGVVSNFKKVM
ncbi:conserved hypothetical protein [Pseudovibrio sp. JE062]|nr:conserved hypothetical protein [Pseudovibrio sp. JE062]